MTYSTLLYEVDEAIATVTLNRPKRLNAVDRTMAREVAAALGTAASDDAVRCVVLTGAGRAFSAGADLMQFGAADADDDGAPPSIGDILRKTYNPMVAPIASMEKPIVASVNGIAAGAGASLALACDFRIASEDAGFLQAFIRLGLVPDCGANFFLTRLVGTARAAELAMLGETIGAEEALRIGLVTKVVPADKLAEETRAFARRLADGPTKAYGFTRKALAFAASNDLASTLDYEADLQALAALTQDVIEGITAFQMKRPAKFQGR